MLKQIEIFECSYKLPSIYSFRKSYWTCGNITIQMDRNFDLEFQLTSDLTALKNWPQKPHRE